MLPTDAATAARPTRVRYTILGLLCVLAMITYLDRAMYGSAKEDMMNSVGRPVEDFFYILTAFQLAYALFEIPTGWLGDRFGPRITLLRLVIWWSTFVVLTPLIGVIFPVSIEVAGTTVFVAFLTMIGAEFLFGMGEAGAFPNISKAAYNWFPASERGFAKGAVWMSARFAGGMTPLVWVLLTVYLLKDFGPYTWRMALWIFAVFAAIWCVIFAFWFRNLPSEHRAVGDAERAKIEAGKSADTRARRVPWGWLVTQPNLWAVCLMYTVTNFNWYFLMYYLPGEFKKAYNAGLDDERIANPSHLDILVPALLAGTPLLIGMFGCYLGGVLSDAHVRRTGDRKWARRTYGMFGYGMAGVAYAGAALAAGNVFGLDPSSRFWALAGCLILVGFFNDLIMGPAWATTQDIGGRYVAIVGGTMNMIGNLVGATLGNYITGSILKEYTVDGAVQPAGLVTCFVMYAVIYAVGVVLWLFIDASRPVVPPEDEAEATPIPSAATA